MKTVTAEQFKQLYGAQGLAQFSQPTAQPGAGATIGDAFKSGVDQVKQGASQITNSTGNPLDLVEGVGRIGSGAISAAFSPLAPVTKPIGQAVNAVADKISDIPAVQKFANTPAGQGTARVAENVANYANIAGTVGGAMEAPKVATGIKNTAQATATKTGEMVNKGLQPVKNVVQGIKDVAEPLIQEGKRIPERIATNVAEKQATQQTINKLPTNIARQGAQDGLDVADIKSIYSIAKDQKAPLKKLAQVTKDFAEGKTKTNPIEVVGKPITARIKQLETQRGAVGQKLGKVAENLGTVSTKEMEPAVFESLKKVPGLSGLKMHTPESLSASGLSDAELATAHASSGGKMLNFSDTVLASELSKADQKSIQSIFSEAIKDGTGKQKHLLRQELFEILGGKKKALTNLTDTQEKAYNAVRQGLSDVLESKNGSYKSLSSQYRKIAQPLQDMRGYMKKVVGADEDIQDMSAGLLARRLTSAAKSNPEIRNVLRSMDKATKVPGKASLNVETLQDFYNILEKYYNIAPKTGFQAQVTQGVEKAVGGPLKYLAEKVKSYAGETPAVRQKALENILNEVLR